jgi:DNA-binding beta-propeller fold protein YncE
MDLFVVVGGLPAAVRNHAKNAVSISGERLSEVLEAYYGVGARQVDVVVGLDGQQLVVTCTIHRKVDRRTNHIYYWLYPLGTGQYLLRERYKAFRGVAGRYAKTPMPIVIYSIMPKKTA